MGTAFNREADSLIGAGKYAEARVLLEAAIAEMPEGWQPRHLEGRTLHVAFWDEEEFLAFVNHAQPGFGQMVAWDLGSYSKAWYQLAVVACEQERMEEALFCVDRGLELEPDQPELWNERGYLLGVRKQYQEALDCYERAASIRDWVAPSEVARSLRGQAVQLIDLGRPEEAEVLLRRSLELEPESHVAHNELQYLDDLRRRRDAQLAQIPWYMHTATNPPTDPLTVSLLALVEDLPAIPGPETLGPQGYTQVLHAFMKHGWPGFEKEFDRLVPRDRPDYTDLKRDLLREPMFSPATHRRLANLAMGDQSVDESQADNEPARRKPH